MAAPAEEHETLRGALALALAPAFGDVDGPRALAASLLRDVPDAASPEASLRIDAGAVRGGRMMLERVGADCPRRVASGLGLPWVDLAEELLGRCEALGLPRIAGWDVGAPDPVYKLYANASDASVERREELARGLGLGGAPPHVVGVNVSAASVTLKAYVQAPVLGALALSPDVAPPAAFVSIDAAAWIASYDRDGDGLSLRALFAAPRHGREASARAALSAMAGVGWDALAERFPFAPGPLRQLGWSPSGAVTVYAKRRGAAAPVNALDPVAVFRTGGGEVGLYVEPTDATPRAFVRTARHALSFRTRQGAPDGSAIEALGRWAAARVSEAERRGAAPDLDGPPAPWARVDAGS